MDVNRKARRRRDRGIAGPEQGQAHVAETLLGADGCDDFLVRIEADVKARFVAVGDLAAQVEDAGGDAVAVVSRVAGRLAELVDDPLLGRVGRVAHSQVDHVDPVAPLAVLELVDAPEQVRRQVADPGRDVEVVALGRLMLFGAGVGLGVDHPGPRLLFGRAGVVLAGAAIVPSSSDECDDYAGAACRTADGIDANSRNRSQSILDVPPGRTPRLGWNPPRSTPRIRVNLDYHRRRGRPG